MNLKAFLIVLFVIIIVILAWAPWMDNRALHDRVFEERAHIDGTIDKETGELLCDYNVIWIPFGRYVTSCEGGYFVWLFEF
ncbi:MAG: hypothetical protein JW716_03580 [Candidatus Aenigmarchaeota archaeon]|nr:hypothetical protein [Candidatus Aenigmarchaeota archaeon]